MIIASCRIDKQLVDNILQVVLGVVVPSLLTFVSHVLHDVTSLGLGELTSEEEENTFRIDRDRDAHL